MRAIQLTAKAMAKLLCGASLVMPAMAYAQTVASEQDDDANTIIVTAQRRAEALEAVPMSVAVLSSAALESAGVNSLRDIANVTSGFQLAAGGSYPQPAIRGVTTTINGSYENNVVVYIDDVYQPVAQSINIDLPNVENVQVLKGPQGTLYGRNATGGAILLNTISPTDEWHSKAEITYARFNDKRASAYVSGPLNDMFGLSVAGYYRRADSYNKLASRIVPGETQGYAAPVNQDAIRAKLVGKLTDNFKATLAFNYVHPNGKTAIYIISYSSARIYGWGTGTQSVWT